MHRGVVALEEDDVAAVAADEGTGVPTEIDTVVEAVAEVDESVADQEVVVDQIEEAGEVVEALESLIDVMGLSVKNGGMDKHAAAAVSIATQYMYSRVGMSKKAMPALESFGGTSTRVGATQLAMEGFKDAVVKIWDAIIAQLKKFGAWIMGHMNKVFGTAERLVKRADAIIKAADAGSAKKMEEKSFENKSLVKALYIGTAVPTDVKAALGVVATLVKETANKSVSDEDTDKIVSALESKEAVQNIKLDKVTPDSKFSPKFGTQPDGVAVSATEELPGGFVHMKRGPSKDEGCSGLGALKMFPRVKNAVVAIPESKVPSTEKLKTLSMAEIEATAEVCKVIAEEIVQFRKTQTKLEERLKKAQKAAETAKKNENSTDEGEQEHAKAVRAAAQALPVYIITPATSITQYGLKAAAAGLTYCEASLKQFK